MTTAVTISPDPILQFFDNLGRPLVGGTLLTQVGGVNTTTYQDSAGTVALPNPIPLNSRGEVSNAAGTSCQLFLQTGVVYTFTLFDAAGNQINQASYVATQANVSSASLIAATGAGLVGFSYTASYPSGTVGLALQGFVNIKGAPFNAKGDGVTDDTAAITAALATGLRIYFPEGTYVTTKQTLNNDIQIYGAGRYKSTFFLKVGTNDHGFVTSGDFKVTARDIGFNGNYLNNPNLSPNFPVGVLVPIGSCDIQNCYFTGWRDHAFHCGNTDYQFSAGVFAHDIIFVGNVVDQGNATAALFDCVRVHRTLRAKITNNICIGGDSSIRSNYYCDSIDISHNLCYSNWNDVGVTAALSTNVTIVGNTCLGNGQHGIECDGVVYGLVADNVCQGNVKNGIMVTEYGPPAGTNYAGSVNGVPITNPQVMSNYDVRFDGNVCANNGQFGLRCIGQAGIVISNNTFENNNTATGNPAGLSIEGGNSLKDDVEVYGNDFRNTGNQTQSIAQANVQGQTRTGKNFHTPGTPQWQFAVRGGPFINGLFNDPGLLNASNVSVTPGVIIEDTLSAKHYARQILDSSSGSSVTLQINIVNLPAAGDKFMVFRIRTPDTMTACMINVNLYTGATFKDTISSISVTGLTSAWREIFVRIPDSAKSFAYDNIQASIVTSSSLTGSINVDEVSLAGVYEL